MAYMSQQNKQSIAPVVKAILKKYGIKGSLAVRHNSTLVLNIKSGRIDFVGNFNKVGDEGKHLYTIVDGYIQVNEYHYMDHFDGVARDCLGELIDAMNIDNHDNSDYQTDYFDIGWYVHVNIGQWDKPYLVAVG
jgi:hypothetical protein